MEKYKNLNRDSNVANYEIKIESITVQFNDGAVYEYTVQSVGPTNMKTMISLANEGRGLNSFINRVVRKKYSRKVR